MKKNLPNLLCSYIRSKLLLCIVLLFFTVIFYTLSFIFSLPAEILSYTLLLTFAASLTGSCIEFYLYYKKNKKLESLYESIPHAIDALPQDAYGIEKSYEDCIVKFNESYTAISSEYEKKLSETENYFTLWTHEIKTPLTALKAHIQSSGGKRGTELDSVITQELLKIEQYADMALQYIRIGSPQTDFVFSKVDIYAIVKQSVKKFAPLFISSKNTLVLNEFSAHVLSDEKWLSFVIDQIISNALKYTKNGRISVYMDEYKEDVLVIEDTGIGISAEDIQRLGEKGFTGCNGRLDKKASGLGLYLSKTILKMLGHTLSFASQSGRGTRVFLSMHKKSV